MHSLAMDVTRKSAEYDDIMKWLALPRVSSRLAGLFLTKGAPANLLLYADRSYRYTR